MPTYRLSARNQFRSPSGAVGEAPDGPGGMAALADDLDGRLGIGGAEYCATSSAVLALPTSRTFPGKLAYSAADDSIWRYWNGAWQLWQRGPIAFTPTFSGITLGGGTVTGWNAYSEGTYYGSMHLAFGAGTALGGSLVTVPQAINDNDIAVGSWAAFDGSGNYGGGPLVKNSGTGATSARMIFGAGGQVGASAPTWLASGAHLGVQFRYRPAALIAG